MLSEFARTLGRDFSIEETLNQFVLVVLGVLPVSGAAVTLMSRTGEPRIVATSDENVRCCEEIQLSVSEGPFFDACQSGEPVAVFDLRTDLRFPRLSFEASRTGFAALLAFPLCQGDARFGALILYRTTAGAFDETIMTAARTLADVAAAHVLIAQARTELAVTSERARQSSLHDEEAVRALRSSEQRKTAILASALDAVITIDDQGRIIEFNPAAERTFGCSEREAGGVDLAVFVAPPEGLDHQWTRLDDYVVTNDGPDFGRRIECAATRSDGSTFPAEVSISGVDGVGPRFFTAFVRDLTSRHAADVERQSLERRVQQTERLESLGQLAGGVAHDFNNLLTVILNFASFIADAETNSARTRSEATEIVSAAERAARLTQQLLLFARREPVRLSPMDLGAVVTDVHGLLKRSIGEHVNLVVRTPAGLPPVTGDRGQTEQLLMNLAVNARDAMPDGGTLTIETALLRHGTDSIVQLTVTDTGTGMSAAVAAHAFDPFFTTKGRDGGTGLGLATVYGIVNDAGGTVDLTSSEGHGTTFTVRLPVAADPVALAPLPPLAPLTTSVGANGYTILVVEDQRPVRNIVVTMLEHNGYAVLEAADATEALAFVGTEQFDLLLTDVVLPGPSGRDLAFALSERLPASPVLYMSGYSGGVFGTRRALDLNEAMIHKPFNEATLLAAVCTALGCVDGAARHSSTACTS